MSECVCVCFNAFVCLHVQCACMRDMGEHEQKDCKLFLVSVYTRHYSLATHVYI